MARDLVILKEEVAPVFNAFCPTGAGGGRDPTCSPKGGSKGGGASPTDRRNAAVAGAKVSYTKAEVASAKKGVHYVTFNPLGGSPREVRVKSITGGRAKVQLVSTGEETRLNHVATLDLVEGKMRSSPSSKTTAPSGGKQVFKDPKSLTLKDIAPKKKEAPLTPEKKTTLRDLFERAGQEARKARGG